MDLSFGARLRLHRERQQVPLRVIAEQTKIKMSLLDGLERDDLSHWPGGIFRRSYVRAYAHAIGLEPEAVVGEFLERYPDPVEDLSGALAVRADEDPNRPPPTRLSCLISSAISALPALRRSPDRPADEAAVRGESDVPKAPGALPHERLGLPTAADLFATASTAEPAASNFIEIGSLAFDPPAEADADDSSAEASDRPADTVPPAADAASKPSALPPRPDLSALSELCTRLGCAVSAADLTSIFADAVRILEAVGLTLWTWDPVAGVLRPALSHGYPDALVAQLPRVRPEADNAIARAYRAGGLRVVNGGAHASGAVAVPLLTPAGCAGVLAVEFQDGAEQREPIQAIAAILAAQLSTLVEQPAFAQAVIA